MVLRAPFDSRTFSSWSFFTRPLVRQRWVTRRSACFFVPWARFRAFFEVFAGALPITTNVGVDRIPKASTAPDTRPMSALTMWADSPYSRASSLTMPSIT